MVGYGVPLHRIGLCLVHRGMYRVVSHKGVVSMSKIKPEDHPDFVGGWVWTKLELDWINGRIAELSAEIDRLTAAQRQWVGVTLSDREKLRDQFEGWSYPAILVDAVSDILEEKNT